MSRAAHCVWQQRSTTCVMLSPCMQPVLRLGILLAAVPLEAGLTHIHTCGLSTEAAVIDFGPVLSRSSFCPQTSQHMHFWTALRRMLVCQYTLPLQVEKKAKHEEELHMTLACTSSDAEPGLDVLPDCVCSHALLSRLAATELAAVSAINKRLHKLGASPPLWLALYEARWGKPSALSHRAAKIAGGWRQLYGSKHMEEKRSAPWAKPCGEELQASLDDLLRQKACEPEKELCVVFLLDGSGSVHEEDFATMTSFVTTSTATLQAAAPDCKVGVVQFSNEVRVEVTPGELDNEGLTKAINNMARMNGGTNIALAIQKAGQLLKRHVAEDAIRQVVLITDGRVDTYQAKEARQMAERLADEQRNVCLYAFGVGRGVDKAELLHIIGTTTNGCTASTASERYMDLYVREEAPW